MEEITPILTTEETIKETLMELLPGELMASWRAGVRNGLEIAVSAITAVFDVCQAPEQRDVLAGVANGLRDVMNDPGAWNF